MKLSISNIAWLAGEDDRVYDLMKKYGFSGLEAAPTRFFREAPYDKPVQDIRKVKESILEKGLNVAALQSLHYGETDMALFEGAEKRSNLLRHTKKAILFAENLGAKILVFGSPKMRNINDYNYEYPTAVNFFRELGDFAHTHGCYVCIEANPKEYSTNFINTTSQAYKLVSDVSSPGFGLHIDTSTMILNNENPDIVEQVVGEIRHVHISSPFLNGIDKSNDGFYRRFANILKKHKYENYSSIEMKRAEENNLGNIENALQYVSEVFGGND